MADCLDQLFRTLDQLGSAELKRFKAYLSEKMVEGFEPIAEGRRRKSDATDIATRMREAYKEEGSLKVTQTILRKMKRNDLADNLQRCSTSWDQVSEDALRRHVSLQLKNELKRKHSSIFEGPEENKVQLDEVYIDLHVTEGVSEEVNTQHEVQQIQTQTKHQTKKDTVIKCNDIMNSSPGKQVRTVMTAGIAGIGKSVSVQKFCLDWAEGTANQDIDFIFVFPFRDLNILEKDQHNLPSLLLYFYPELEELKNVQTYNKSKILFVFDGLDESKLELDFKSNQKLHFSDKSSVGTLLSNLFQGHLLQSSLIWVTSRPAAANQIPSCYIDKWTEIRGFNDDQKDKYFSKRITNTDPHNIISQIKTRRSLYIMCHIPVFCWILFCVLQEMLTQEGNMEIPKSMTELFIHFLLIQTNRKHQRCYGGNEPDRNELLERHKDHILKLSELAFKQLEKGNILFSKQDLRESGIEDSLINEYSEMCTEIFKRDRTFYRKTFYCFVHLSVQEFLAALHVFYSFVNKNYKGLESFFVIGAENDGESNDEEEETDSDSYDDEDSDFGSCGEGSYKESDKERPMKKRIASPREGSVYLDNMPMHVLLNGAVKKSLQFNNGHLDLFLRFLLGISLESNQELLQGLLPQVENSSASAKTTAKCIKKILDRNNNSVERCLNLLLCLLEMKDNSLHKEIGRLVESGKELTPAQCSVQAYLLLMSEEVLDKFNLTMYRTNSAGRERLLIVLKVCRKARLHGCGLSGDACRTISSHLQCENACLRELDLSSNPLEDAGMELLSAGLKHTHCRLETLSLAGCGLSGESCRILSLVLQSEGSVLRALDLSCNALGDAGVELLSPGLKHTNCRLDTLRLAECELTSSACQTLASVLQSDESHLTELDLTNNDLTDSGAKELCAALGHRNCKLEMLRLSGCLISQTGCGFIASALTSTSSHLTEVDLSYNHLGDAGLQMLSTLPDGPVAVKVDHSSEGMLQEGLRKYYCDVTLDRDRLHTRFVPSCISERYRKRTRQKEKPYPDYDFDYFDTDNYDRCRQLWSTEPLAGRCYWEWKWYYGENYVGVTYKHNGKSWCLKCLGSRYYASYNGIHTRIPATPSDTIGVYLDHEAGTVSFYSASDTLTHLYTFNTTFTDEPLYAVRKV